MPNSTDYSESAQSNVSESETEIPLASISHHPEGVHVQKHLLNFYEDDELCRLAPTGTKIQFGLVKPIKELDPRLDYQIIWTLGNSIEVQELDGNSTPESFSDIRLIDRKVQIGDAVRVGGREGEVVDVDFVACLKTMENNLAIINVPCDNLEPVLAYHVGQSLVVDGWLGVIASVEIDASLMLPNGKTCVINLNKVPKSSKKPYPGGQVLYTVDEYVQAGAEKVDSGENFVDLFTDDDEVPAFVFFIKVGSVDIDWKLQLPTRDQKDKPPKTLGRLSLKHNNAKILRPPKEHFWGSENPSIYDNYFRYAVQSEDLIFPDCNKNLERLLIEQLFPHDVEEDLERSVPITNASLVAKILRTTRIASVKWNDTGEITKIPSSMITEMHHFKEPYHQIVQKSLIFSPSTSETFGICLERDPSDIVLVQWFNKKRNKSNEIIQTGISKESKFDLEPHFLYGDIVPGGIALPTLSCKIPVAIFSLGIVQKVTSEGRVIVQDSFTKQECSLVPFEINVVSSKTIAEAKLKDEVVKPSSTKRGIFGDSLRTIRDSSFESRGALGRSQNQKQSLFSPMAIVNFNSATLPLEQKFEVLPTAPGSHYFYMNLFPYQSEYVQTVEIDREVLKGIFTDGIWVKGYKDRRDLYSVMITGGKGTPYEDGLFHLDIQIPQRVTYMKASPPDIYMTTSLSLNFGPKMGPKRINFKELGNGSPKTILEAVLTVQRSIFNNDEVLNLISKDDTVSEMDELKMKKVLEHVRNGNSEINMAVLDLLIRQLLNPPSIWENDIIRYLRQNVPKILSRLEISILQSSSDSDEIPNSAEPYKLLSISKGFVQAVQNRIEKFRELCRIPSHSLKR